MADFENGCFRRLLLVVPPGTEAGQAFRNPNGLNIDLSDGETAAGDEYLIRVREQLPRAGRLRVDHLEAAFGGSLSRSEPCWISRRALARGFPQEPDASAFRLIFSQPRTEATLRLFEAALANSMNSMNGLRILAISYGDPIAVLAAEENRLKESAPSDEDSAASDGQTVLQRWREILFHFTQQRATNAGNPQPFEEQVADSGMKPEQEALIGECRWSRPRQEVGQQILESSAIATMESGYASADTKEAVIQCVARETDSHDRDLWRALGREERHLLAQIASGCMVNQGLRQQLHLAPAGLDVNTLTNILSVSYPNFSSLCRSTVWRIKKKHLKSMAP